MMLLIIPRQSGLNPEIGGRGSAEDNQDIRIAPPRCCHLNGWGTGMVPAWSQSFLRPDAEPKDTVLGAPDGLKGRERRASVIIDSYCGEG